MAQRLAISRAAVWKRIEALRREGYVISSSTGRGYRLMRSPDLLDADRIGGILRTGWLGRDLVVLSEVGSTNEAMMRLAREGKGKNGAVILAERQSEGRGRLSRPWASPEGGVWMSMILRPDLPLSELYRINMALSVAICRAIDSLFGLKLEIKWPNDLLVSERKICGILMEVMAQVDRLDCVVAGIGINANNDASAFPSEWHSTSLFSELGRPVDREELIAAILLEAEAALDGMLGPAIYEEWRRRSCTLHRRVRIASQSGDLEGTVVDLDRDGALLLKCNGEIRRVLAGDCIHLRPLSETRDESGAVESEVVKSGMVET